MKDKRGVTTIFIFVLLIATLLSVIFLIVIGSFSTHMNEALSKDIDVGQVNLKNVSDATIGKYNTMVLNNADWWGMSIIFGMVIALFLISYFARNTFPKMSIVLDIFFIFVSFLVSLYLSAIYNDLVVTLSLAGETFAETNLQTTSYFILNLPLFIVVIGVIMMILFHAGIPRKPEEANIITSIAA